MSYGTKNCSQLDDDSIFNDGTRSRKLFVLDDSLSSRSEHLKNVKRLIFCFFSAGNDCAALGFVVVALGSPFQDLLLLDATTKNVFANLLHRSILRRATGKSKRAEGHRRCLFSMSDHLPAELCERRRTQRPLVEIPKKASPDNSESQPVVDVSH